MITKLRFKIELIFYYLKRNWLLFLLGAAIGAALFIFRQPLLKTLQKLGQPYQKIGVEGLYTVYTLPLEISQKISYGLIINNENGKPELSPIVKSLDIRRDNTQYVFKINTDYSWHSGRKLSAHDITYKIPGLTITPNSNTQLTVETEKTFAPLLSSLSAPLIKKNFNGLGAYRVTRYDFQDGYLKTLILKSSEDTIKYNFYQNETELLNAFKIGEVDQIKLSSLPQNLNNWPKVKITSNVSTDQNYLAIFLNTAKLNNKQLRQALAYATEKTNELNERALSPISPLSWAYNPDVKDYAFNPSKAKEFFEKNKIDSINLAYNDRRLIETAEKIKKNWQEILGINVNINITNQIDTENFDAILAYGSITADPDQYLFWHSTQSKSNITKINNPKIDKLLEEGRQSTDQMERKKTYQEFQKILLEECPAIFLKYPTIYTISRIR